MKSEFLLAFNQICAERNLPREVVLEAVRTAFVSAYRRNVGAPSTQNITAQIDPETGRTYIFVERQVVAEVSDPELEITLEKARAIDPEVQLGDAVMVESTPDDFGRIAAQTARQVILQRIREAEREAQYAHYVEQEGELVYGTVQSVTPQQATLHLERTEAILPRREMVPGERYVLHDRIRAYVVEVRKTSRGPQIVVSRSHRKMLQRLLELEVPEIANGTVEIKAVAREAGSRSKVAVVARQQGVDPVGACVGMRGMRIQSIVKELGGEKVDIIEWSPEPVTFIAKALGPAKVLSVVLEEDPVAGRLASVVVPDDQLSLAIGKAGQNARLAAKLTGWRIDIQGVTEAAEWALQQINEDPEVLPSLGQTAEVLPMAAGALRRHKEEGFPYNAEELVIMRQVIEGVRAHIIAARDAQRARLAAEEASRRAALDEARAAREASIQEARALIPAGAYDVPLDELGLSARVLGHLERNGLGNAGQLMEHLAEGDEGLLRLDGIGPKSLAEVREALDRLDLPVEEVEPVAAEAPAAEVEPELVAVAEEAVPAEAEMPPAEISAEAAEEVEAEVEAVEAGAEAPVPAEPAAEAVPELEEELAPAAAPAAAEAVEEGIPEEWVWEEGEEPEPEPETESEEDERKRRRKPARQLVYDEELDQVVSVRRHRRGEEEEWEDLV